ncbi:multicopper oxidase domain-containing protein [Neobacillus sp. SM06]|uniref:multicopper oxidase domain-containing protein n=1 Tax=Neobacillus sp. SM06 TaxID=3422492 RepID=UPI003D290491
MYHSHVHNAIQELMGLDGMFIVRGKKEEPVQRDYVLLLQEWAVKTGSASMDMEANQPYGGKGQESSKKSSNMSTGVKPGTYEIDPKVMMYNYFTINGKAYPSTDPLFVRYGDRVRLRLGNLSMDSHPMHFHGHDFLVTAADGNAIPSYVRLKKNTINVAPGETWDIEFFANNPGNWVFHCHKPHHTANAHSKGLGGMLTIVRYTT